VAAMGALVPSIASEFGVSHFVAGKAVSLYMVPYGVAALLYGPLVRFFDAKKIELICFFLFCGANLLAAAARSIGMFFTARFLMGIFGASVIPLVLILIARQSDSAQRGRLVGLFFSATFVASLLGLLLSGIIPWRMIFLIPAVFGLLLLVYMYLYLENFKPDAQERKIHYCAALADKKVLFLFGYIFFISLLYHGVQQWLGVYFSQRFNFSQFLISMLITLTSLSGIIGEIIGGISSDSLGRQATVNTGIILMILSAVLLTLKLPLAGVALLMVAWGLGWSFNHAGLSTLLTDLPKNFVNEAASLNSSVRFIAGGLGVAVSGAIVQKNFNLGFLSFACGLLLLLFFTHRLLREE
jgi:predicted MFS family arabinose efflux permease